MQAALEEALQLPNITHPDVPIGPEDNARTVRLIGTKPDAATVDHTLIGKIRQLGPPVFAFVSYGFMSCKVRSVGVGRLRSDWIFRL